MLDTVLNENTPTAHEAIYKAMNGRGNISFKGNFILIFIKF